MPDARAPGSRITTRLGEQRPYQRLPQQSAGLRSRPSLKRAAHGPTIDDLLRKFDELLYEAKRDISWHVDRRVPPYAAPARNQPAVGAAGCARSPKKLKAAASKAACRCSRKRRRNSLRSGLTARKKFGRPGIHRVPSDERPPPGRDTMHMGIYAERRIMPSWDRIWLNIP
jgi:hypothetical protein